MTNLLHTYRALNINILYLIVACFCLQLVNAAFFLTLNIYMTKCGYLDYEIASYISYRFMAVMFFALPFGMYIKGKRLRPVFLSIALSVPTISLIILEAIAYRIDWLLQISFILWGIAFSGVFICTLPFILRNTDPSKHTAAISLNTATWSIGTIVAGFGIYLLTLIAPNIFTNKILLQLFCLLGYTSVFFVLKMSKQEEVGEKSIGFNQQFYQYNWKAIAKVVLPTLMIAIGAGLTIPFMNLFFYHVFGIDADLFSLLGSLTSIVVAAAALLVPIIKYRFGYEAITVTQTLAVIALFLLGSTDFLSHYSIAIYLAIFCYIIRQPLMNLANPMTSEMSMYYVGKNNQEIVAAINSSVWSGSWFISAQIFRWLRESLELRYGYVFYLTAAFYMVGVLIYFLLIKDFRRKEKAGLIKR